MSHILPSLSEIFGYFPFYYVLSIPQYPTITLSLCKDQTSELKRIPPPKKVSK